MHTGRIDKNDLGAFQGEDAELALAGSLRAGRNCGNFLSQQGIDQG